MKALHRYVVGTYHEIKVWKKDEEEVSSSLQLNLFKVVEATLTSLF